MSLHFRAPLTAALLFNFVVSRVPMTLQGLVRLVPGYLYAQSLDEMYLRLGGCLKSYAFASKQLF